MPSPTARPSSVPPVPSDPALPRTYYEGQAAGIRDPNTKDITAIGATPQSNWRRGPADDRMLAASARYGVISARQAATQFYGGHLVTARRRYRYLKESGLLKVSNEVSWANPVIWATPKGARLVAAMGGTDLRAPEWPGERLLHRLATVDVGFAAERSGRRIITEREIRAAEGGYRSKAEDLAASLNLPITPVVDGQGRTRWFTPLKGSKGETHYPDLVVPAPGGLVAVEVEVSLKTPAELARILRAYQQSRGMYAQVLYFTTGPISNALIGYQHPETSEWIPGAAQNVGLIPEGPYKDHAENRIRVLPITAEDPGVAWQLDMRQVLDLWRVGLRDWQALRDRWAADPDGKPIGYPFLNWWAAQPRNREGVPGLPDRTLRRTSGAGW